MPRKREGRDPKTESLQEHGVLHPSPARVEDDRFHEGAFFDPRDMVQVKYEMLRRVEKDGWSVSQAAGVFGFSRPSFYNAKAALAREGLTGLLPKKRGPRGAHKLTDEVLDFVEGIRAKKPKATSPDLVERIERKFGLTVHPRSVERALVRRSQREGRRG